MQLGESAEAIGAIHRTLASPTRAAAASISATAGSSQNPSPAGARQGLAGDELGDKTYLVLDGIDGRVHHVEYPDASKLDDVQRGMIVEATPPLSSPRAVNLNIAEQAGPQGIYQPGRHLEQFLSEGKDPQAYVHFHVRRLEALRRAGHVERLHAEHWRVPKDMTEAWPMIARSPAADPACASSRISASTSRSAPMVHLARPGDGLTRKDTARAHRLRP